MKQYMNKYYNIARVEFWVVTTILVFTIFFNISDAIGDNEILKARRARGEITTLDYILVSNILDNLTLYLAFLYLNFKVVPKLLQRENLVLNILLSVLTFLVVGFILGMVETYLKYQMVNGSENNLAHNNVIKQNYLFALWMMLQLVIYTALKYAGIYILSKSEVIQSRYKFITHNTLVAFVTWMIVFMFLLLGEWDTVITAAWAIVILSAIALYSYSFSTLIPMAFKKKKVFKSYFLNALLVLLVIAMPAFFMSILITDKGDESMGLVFFNTVFQLFITVPFTWMMYKNHIKGREEISVLQTALGNSNANLDFLRSQINPHFLFNALNTIYGTALQEKAERTSEGIEKLGDMMRFMLQENMQDKISLEREINYMSNYISLHKLRTDTNPVVRIEERLPGHVNGLDIAPMLLIPFVENAFKHGISLREPSYIKVSMETRDGNLYFDVYNNKHQKQGEDPEKNKSGIGLNNVKLRLQLLYPGKHELVIRETATDYFVHLTLNLS